MAAGRIIAVAGPAAAGKSTLTRALQSAFARNGELWLVMELDNFARGLSRHWIAVEEQRGRYAERGFSYDRTVDGGVVLTLGEDGRRILAAFHAAIAAVARSGTCVICETVVYDNADWGDWQTQLAGLNTTWVRVSAPPDVLDAREQADPTRAFKGLARGMLATQTAGVFALEADTSTEDTASVVSRILAL